MLNLRQNQLMTKWSERNPIVIQGVYVIQKRMGAIEKMERRIKWISCSRHEVYIQKRVSYSWYFQRLGWIEGGGNKELEDCVTPGVQIGKICLTVFKIAIRKLTVFTRVMNDFL